MKKFDKNKYLKKIKIKRWLSNYSRYLYLGLSCILVCTLGVYLAYSKFFVSKEEAVIKTTVGNFIQGDVVIGAYIDNEYSSTIPGKDDGYVVEKIVCDNGATGEWNNDKWGLLTTNLTKRTKCNVYFKKDYLGPIIAQLDTTGNCPTVNDDGSVNVTAKEATNGYLCKAKDAYGDSYYYRGNVANNYVKFGTWSDDVPDIVRGYYSELSTYYKEYSSLEECQSASSYNVNCTLISNAGKEMYWRIVRINGNGTVRVIYDGTSAHSNDEASIDRQIGNSSFNVGSNGNIYAYDNAYVGYMYGITGASTYAETHANTNDSTIKSYIDNWYKTNILGTANEQYLADNVFCNDRSFNDINTGTGAGTSYTEYRWFSGPWDSELYSKYNNKTMLTCPQQNDAFTVSDTTNGNGALTYPVGLLSMDEVLLAGGWTDSNSGYYLYSGQEWWASSPLHSNTHTRRAVNVRFVNSNGSANDDSGSGYAYNLYGVRPVFNLKAEVLKYGDGTLDNPYHL